MTPILPVVGSTGFYELSPPFNLLVVDAVEYTCKAIRRISDYLANNEIVKDSVYTKYGIADSLYEEDLAGDAYIVSLQSRTGHWLYVPYRFILSYPSVNGVPYRSVMIGISLPALPAAQDLSVVLADVKDLVESRLGVATVAKFVETSKVTLIPSDIHETKRVQRELQKQGDQSQYGTIVKLTKENALLRTKVQALEAYILAHPVP